MRCIMARPGELLALKTNAFKAVRKISSGQLTDDNIKKLTNFWTDEKAITSNPSEILDQMSVVAEDLNKLQSMEDKKKLAKLIHDTLNKLLASESALKIINSDPGRSASYYLRIHAIISDIQKINNDFASILHHKGLDMLQQISTQPQNLQSPLPTTFQASVADPYASTNIQNTQAQPTSSQQSPQSLYQVQTKQSNLANPNQSARGTNPTSSADLSNKMGNVENQFNGHRASLSLSTAGKLGSQQHSSMHFSNESRYESTSKKFEKSSTGLKAKAVKITNITDLKKICDKEVLQDASIKGAVEFKMNGNQLNVTSKTNQNVATFQLEKPYKNDSNITCIVYRSAFTESPLTQNTSNPKLLAILKTLAATGEQPIKAENGTLEEIMEICKVAATAKPPIKINVINNNEKIMEDVKKLGAELETSFLPEETQAQTSRHKR